MNANVRPLVVLGEHDSTGTGLDYARLLAAPQQRTAITAVDVNEFLDNYVDVLQDIVDGNELKDLVLQHRREQLVRLLRRGRSSRCDYESIEVLEGIPFVEIIRACVRNGNDIIIKVADGDNSGASHDRGFSSTDMHLIRKSPAPVLMLDPTDRQVPDRLLAAVDVSGPHMAAVNERIVDQAAVLADRLDCELHLLTAWHLRGEHIMRHNPLLKIDEQRIGRLGNKLMTSAEQRMQVLVRRARRATRLRRNPVVHIVKGTARNVVPAFVEQHDISLLLMGAVGHTDIPGLFIGTTAESILNRVSCSVLAMKPAGFITPVALAPKGVGVDPMATREFEQRRAAG